MICTAETPKYLLLTPLILRILPDKQSGNFSIKIRFPDKNNHVCQIWREKYHFQKLVFPTTVEQQMQYVDKLQVVTERPQPC